jgi:hypothetical protein
MELLRKQHAYWKEGYCVIITRYYYYYYYNLL